MTHRTRGFLRRATGAEPDARTEAAERLLEHARDLQRKARQQLDETHDQRFELEGRLIKLDREIRAPLTQVIGYLELLLDGEAGPLTEEQTAMMLRIDAGARHLKAVVENLVVETTGRTDP
jgi:signal transduction histidine kinase